MSDLIIVFILPMEILSNFVRQNDNITGLSLDDQRTKVVKIIQYADDTTLIFEKCPRYGRSSNIF